jgi:Cupredoxin-like domain
MMRVSKAQFALGVGLLAGIFLVADVAQAGPFLRRRARLAYNTAPVASSYGQPYAAGYDGSVLPASYTSSECCPQSTYGYGYGSSVYSPRRGYANRSSVYPAAGYSSSTSYYTPAGGTALSMPYPTGYGFGQPLPALTPADYAAGGGSVPGVLPSRITDSTPAKITDVAFEPADLTVAPGTTIRWTNAGKDPHTVTAVKGEWDSGNIAPGKDFTATFTQPGKFEYYCKHHKDMKGTITVK